MSGRQYKLVKCTINGRAAEKMVDVRASLADMLRDDYRLTSVKKGCEAGECGACNVIIDGECFNSCIYLAVWADGKSIRTVEGLAVSDAMRQERTGMQPGQTGTAAAASSDEGHECLQSEAAAAASSGIGSECLSDIQQAFIDEAAVQCGFCTPGFLMSAVELLEQGREFSDEEIRKRLSGHLCRCTGYENIFRAVKKTMLRRLGKAEEEVTA